MVGLSCTIMVTWEGWFTYVMAFTSVTSVGADVWQCIWRSSNRWWASCRRLGLPVGDPDCIPFRNKLLDALELTVAGSFGSDIHVSLHLSPNSSQ